MIIEFEHFKNEKKLEQEYLKECFLLHDILKVQLTPLI